MGQQKRARELLELTGSGDQFFRLATTGLSKIVQDG